MGNINHVENKENLFDNIIRSETEDLRKKGLLDSYGGKLEYVDYKNGILGIRGIKTRNITYFLDYKGNMLFSIPGLIEDFGKGKTEKDKFKNGKKR